MRAALIVERELLERFAVLRDVEAHAFGVGADTQPDEQVDHLQHDERDDAAPGDGDDHPDELRLELRGVAFEQAWQSPGRTPEPWLGPSLEEKLAALAEAGRARVLVAPIGFVCDHTEILYDVDVQAQAAARARGITLRRTESLNTSPAFIGALAGIVARAWR